MDAGKIMWVLYEHPEADFMDMAMRFVDIRKRVYTFPHMGWGSSSASPYASRLSPDRAVPKSFWSQ